MASVIPFKQSTLEQIANILADTDSGLTGTEIHKYLLLANIEDVDPTNTKRVRLYNAFDAFQKGSKCANNIANFIKIVLDPSRYTECPAKFEDWRSRINQILAFEGIQVLETGALSRLKEKANKISDVQIRVDNLKAKLEQRDTHCQVFIYCKAELLSDNYFHAVFEANKGLFNRIRDLSGVSEDGNKLIEQVFSTNPILIINNYSTQSEIDEHKGFCNLLKGLCGMFRNPEAHEPKVLWRMTEQDALEILGMISYCHRRLDNSHKIRLA